jgi:hypothetical protein
MKPIKSFLILAIVLVPALASAQGYYGPGGRGGRGGYYQGTTVPGGFHARAGRLTFGASIGLGGMHDDGSAITSCDNCDFNPIAGEFDFHLGGMLTHRFGLMAEAQFNAQTIHSNFVNGDTTVVHSALMLAGQFWLLPQLWIKGGVGLANLRIDDDFFTDDLGNGVALMGAIGVELFSARNFAIELQGRIISGTFNSANDHVTSGTIGVGLNWY